MGLPSPEQLARLGELVAVEGRRCHGKWGKFKAVMTMLAMKAGPTGITSGVSHAIGALGVPSGLTVISAGSVGIFSIAPIGAALAPWIGAATVASQSGKIFGLYDIKEDADKKSDRPVNYTCQCNKCSKNIQYIIDKKERNVAVVAVGVGTLGAAVLAKGVHSIGKSIYSSLMGETRPKERVCKEIIDSARSGCTTAMATVFLLSGSWSLMGNSDENAMRTAVAIIISEDGWAKLKSSW